MKSFRASIVLILAVLGSACAGSGQRMTRAGTRAREPRLPAVAVDRFTVVAQPIGRAQVPTGSLRRGAQGGGPRNPAAAAVARRLK